MQLIMPSLGSALGTATSIAQLPYDSVYMLRYIICMPPIMPACLQLAEALAGRGPTGMQSLHSYSPIEGLPELREALRHKLAERNGLRQVSMRTYMHALYSRACGLAASRPYQCRSGVAVTLQ